MRLIDADALREWLGERFAHYKDEMENDSQWTMAEVIDHLDVAPTACCGDCGWSYPYAGSMFRCDHSPHVEVGFNDVGNGSWGCAYFERRDDD